MSAEHLPWVAMLLGLGNSLAALFLWLRKPGADAEKLVAELSTQVGVLKERVSHVSTSTELTELEGTVKAVQATLEGFRVEQAALRVTLTRVENFLLSQGHR